MKKRFYKKEDLVFSEKPNNVLFDNIEGRKFNRLTVLGFAGSCNGKNVLWYCECSCGNVTKAHRRSLISGDTKSCGCLATNLRVKRLSTHGCAKNGQNSTSYVTWKGIKQRCLNANDKAYVNYGGRGIKVCDRWLRFENFLEDMGDRPKGFSIERIDNNGNYEPGNCRWATMKEQNNNKRNTSFVTYENERIGIGHVADLVGIGRGVLSGRLRLGWDEERAMSTKLVHGMRSDIRLLTYAGVTLPVIEWAKKLNIKKFTLFSRINYGWDTERILTTPVRGNGYKRRKI